MTPEAQRIAIAEACGAEWQDVPPRDGWPYHPKRLLSITKWDLGHPRCAILPLANSVTGDAVSIPDYCADLNAMCAAVGTLSTSALGEYTGFLMDITREYPIGRVPDYHGDRQSLARITNATAAQRAEAFLKTLNLWVDDKDA